MSLGPTAGLPDPLTPLPGESEDQQRQLIRDYMAAGHGPDDVPGDAYPYDAEWDYLCSLAGIDPNPRWA